MFLSFGGAKDIENLVFRGIRRPIPFPRVWFDNVCNGLVKHSNARYFNDHVPCGMSRG